MRLDRAPRAARIALSVGAIAATTGLVYALDSVAPVVSLGSLYLLAIVPIALLFGLAYAVVTSIASMLVFNVLFLPPLYTLTLADGQNWVALAIYVVIAIVVSELATRVRRRAAEAEQRSREEAFLAGLATRFLQGTSVSHGLPELERQLRDVLEVDAARIELGPQRDPPPGESPYELRAAGRGHIGTLYLREGAMPRLAVRKRVLPGLASLLAVAVDREQLGHDALEAEALRRSDTIKTAVLRAVSHDLQSPLTAILASVETLRHATLDLPPGDRAALLETISSEANRLERLVRDLLDLSRLEAGAAEPNRELWTIDELVAQALDGVGPGSERVEVSIPADLPPVEADAVQIGRALANLIENALKFSEPTDPVSVRASATRRDVILRVVDRGPGLAEGAGERLFEPFVRADEAGRGGSGLGLAIAKGFVEANGGRVWADTRPGQGSSFAIALQAAELPATLPG